MDIQISLPKTTNKYVLNRSVVSRCFTVLWFCSFSPVLSVFNEQNQQSLDRPDVALRSLALGTTPLPHRVVFRYYLRYSYKSASSFMRPKTSISFRNLRVRLMTSISDLWEELSI